MSEKESISGKIERLRTRVEWFYGEEFELGAATGEYRQAMGLAKEIEGDLMGLKNEIRVIEEDFGK